METDPDEQENPLKGVPKMLLPRDKFLEISYPIYKPSLFAELLTNEAARTLFSEAVELDTYDSSVPRLSELCKNVLAKEFRAGKLDPRLSQEDVNYIGAHLDVEMPLLSIMDLDNDAFFKRVFVAKSKDMKLKCLKMHDVETDFKKEAIQLKLQEVIETTNYEFWNDEDMDKLTCAIAPHVDELHITQMIPMKERSIERDPNLSEFKIYSYPEKDCHHGSLEMLGNLKNLTKLELELLPPPLGYDYNRRFFYFSYLDIENLTKGLKRLSALNHLTIKRSRLDDKKMKTLTRGLFHHPLAHVEFSYCELRDKAGLCIGKLLQNVDTIRTLELEGNFLAKDGLEPIAYAIRSYTGFLEYYGLARNPVSDDGVYMVGSGFLGNHQVQELNLNGIEVSPEGALRVVELLDFHGKLKKVQMCSLPLGESGGEKLIEFMKGNKLLYKLECRGCDMSLEQEYKIRLLVSRNNYFFENPTLMEEITSKEMEEDANEWTKRVKHPVLLKVNSLLNRRAQCLEMRKTQTVFDEKDMNPFFIHKKAIEQKNNSELLKVHFLECSGLDSEIRYYMPDAAKSDYSKRKDKEPFEYEPNAFEEKDIVRHVRFGPTDRPYHNNFKPPKRARKRYL